jgi:hypothetical protein
VLTTEQINSFWELARQRSVDGGILRRRIAAIGAITVGVWGFLLAVGLGIVVLVFVAGIVVFVGVVALIAFWPSLRTVGSNGTTHLRRRTQRTRAQVVPLGRKVAGTAGKAFAEARARGKALGHVASSVGGFAGESGRAATLRFARRAALLDPEREAIRLNATGTQQRRSGRYDEAVEYHRQALEILRALGDRRSVALTQSNLALALSHAGDDVWAVGLFEEAAATLHELGDEEDEARIMANLGVTHRRHGRPREGDNVLELALSKLSPASSAYQAIEAELRRAS